MPWVPGPTVVGLVGGVSVGIAAGVGTAEGQGEGAGVGVAVGMGVGVGSITETLMLMDVPAAPDALEPV